MFQKVLWQNVRTVERVLLSVREIVCFRDREVRRGCRHLTQLIAVDHVLRLCHHIVLTRLQHRALHGHYRFSSSLHLRTNEAGNVRVRACLSAAVVQLTQASDLWFLRSRFVRLESRLLLLFHIFFRSKELLAVVCDVCIFARLLSPNAIWLVPTENLRVLVLDWNSALEMALLLAVCVAYLRALHNLREHAEFGCLLIWFWPRELIDFNFQLFFSSLLIFGRLDFQCLFLRWISRFVSWYVATCGKCWLV